MLALWARTAPGGLLALVEPATAEGFGQLTLARQILCGDGAAGGDGAASGDGVSAAGGAAGGLGVGAEGGASRGAAGGGRRGAAGDAQIVAPCSHSRRCPLAPGGPLQEWHAGKRRRKSKKAKDLCFSSQVRYAR